MPAVFFRIVLPAALSLDARTSNNSAATARPTFLWLI